MTFDARSKERLQALGRTLPQKLPPPVSSKGAQSGREAPGGATDRPDAAGGRHQLEREADPAELFRALMQASPDGSVPPHLLDRLRDLEGSQPPAPTREAAPSSLRKKDAKGPKGPSAKRSLRSPAREGRGGEDQDLYTAFAQLLLEEDDSA